MSDTLKQIADKVAEQVPLTPAEIKAIEDAQKTAELLRKAREGV